MVVTAFADLLCITDTPTRVARRAEETSVGDMLQMSDAPHLD
jgi:hypothetical protein